MVGLEDKTAPQQVLMTRWGLEEFGPVKGLSMVTWLVALVIATKDLKKDPNDINCHSGLGNNL